jgi:hypothetical protein
MGLFNRERESQHAIHQVELHDATSATISVEMAAGELFLTGGASGLMHGEFVYDEQLAPRIDHHIDAGRAALSIVQSRGGRSPRGKNRWDIALIDSLPLDLDLRVAAGRCGARLASTQVSALTLSQEAGDVSLDLSGHQLALTEIDIRQTAGQTNLMLNGDYARLRSLRVHATTGETLVDLSGSAWGCDLDASIDVTTGATTLRLPRDVGVEVRASSMLGKVTAHGLTRTGDVFHNASSAASPVTLRFSVSASVGKVTLEVGG